MSDSYPNVFGLCKLACAFNLFLVNSSFEEDFLNPSGRLGAMVLLPIDRMERRIDLSSFCFVLVSHENSFLWCVNYILCHALQVSTVTNAIATNSRGNNLFLWNLRLVCDLLRSQRAAVRDTPVKFMKNVLRRVR